MNLVEARQRLLGRMLLDPAFEQRVRSDPEGVSRDESVPVEFVCELARITPERVAEFRESQRHKDDVRAGKQPTKLRW